MITLGHNLGVQLFVSIHSIKKKKKKKGGHKNIKKKKKKKAE